MNCKFGNFRENFIFAKKHLKNISDVKNSRLRHGLHVPFSVNDKVICLFARVLFSRNFAYAKFLENKVLAKISEYQYIFSFMLLSTVHVHI